MKKRSCVPFYGKTDQRVEKRAHEAIGEAIATGNQALRADAEKVLTDLHAALRKRQRSGSARPAAPFVRNVHGYRVDAGRMVAR
jgi:hypothetical protein